MKIKVESESAGRKQEEGILDFFKRNKQGPKRSASPIPQQGQFTQKRSASPIPQKGQFGGQKRKSTYDKRLDKNSSYASWQNMEKENPTYLRNIMYRIAPYFDVIPKDAKSFIQVGGMEYKTAVDNLIKFYRNMGTNWTSKFDLLDLAMSLSSTITNNLRNMLVNPKTKESARDDIMAELGPKIQRMVSGTYDKSPQIKQNHTLSEEKPCWDGYKQVGMKLKLGKKVPNCVPVDESYDLEQGQLNEFVEKLKQKPLEEAEYQGKKVTLNKPIRTPEGPKKFKVYVKDGDKVKMVRFGDPNMKIKKSNPERRKSFRARHNCDNPGPKTSGKYWSCRNW